MVGGHHLEAVNKVGTAIGKCHAEMRRGDDRAISVEYAVARTTIVECEINFYAAVRTADTLTIGVGHDEKGKEKKGYVSHVFFVWLTGDGFTS